MTFKSRFFAKSNLVLLLIFLIMFPFFASDFWVAQIASRTLILGIIGLSLMFLAGYGGMVSLAQMTIAGIATYVYSIVGNSNLGLQWNGAISIGLGILVPTATGALIGFFSVRTRGVYTIMITLAFAVCFFYFVRQNYAIFNGFNGFSQILPPQFFKYSLINEEKTGIKVADFYWVCLIMALAIYFLVVHISKTSFGLALRASSENQRKVRSLGYNVSTIKILAYVFSSLIAAIGGILWGWWNTRISPSAVDVNSAIAILIIVILGGVKSPPGPFLGAFIYILLENFSIDFASANLFKTLTGSIFILVLMFSPNGIYGLKDRLFLGSLSKYLFKTFKHKGNNEI